MPVNSSDLHTLLQLFFFPYFVYSRLNNLVGLACKTNIS